MKVSVWDFANLNSDATLLVCVRERNENDSAKHERALNLPDNGVVGLRGMYIDGGRVPPPPHRDYTGH